MMLCSLIRVCHSAPITVRKFFQRLSDTVHFGMHQRGYDIVNYGNNFWEMGMPSVTRTSYDVLLDLLCCLGLDVSHKKLVPPATTAVCLGIEIDIIPRTTSIPSEKLECIYNMVIEWGSKHFSSMHQLMYIQKCIKPSRIFVNRMLDLCLTYVHYLEPRL